MPPGHRCAPSREGRRKEGERVLAPGDKEALLRTTKAGGDSFICMIVRIAFLVEKSCSSLAETACRGRRRRRGEDHKGKRGVCVMCATGNMRDRVRYLYTPSSSAASETSILRSA